MQIEGAVCIDKLIEFLFYNPSNVNFSFGALYSMFFLDNVIKFYSFKIFFCCFKTWI